VKDFLLAYSDGDVASWKRMRFSGIDSYELSTNGYRQILHLNGLLKFSRPRLPSYFPDDDQWVTDWLRMYSNATAVAVDALPRQAQVLGMFDDYVSAITMGSSYSNYFTGIAAKDTIVVHETITRRAPSLATYPFFKKQATRGHAVDTMFPNLGWERFDTFDPRYSHFDVVPAIEDLLAESKTLHCMNLFTYIRVNEKGKIMPILLRHIFNPRKKEWMLAEMVDCHVMPFRAFKLFL
jgi:hypothetical protein